MENNFWNDEKVKEFCDTHIKGWVLRNTEREIEEFKKSKEVKPNYEILSFYYQTSHKSYANKAANGLFYSGLDFYTEQQMIESVWNIHSVKRISDGETFCNDDVTNLGRICGWKIFNNQMIAQFEGETRSAHLNNLQKVKPQPKLFTTEDGVDIFKGDLAYYVEELNNFMIVSHSGISGKKPHKYFSTIEKAKEYIIWNKPHLSLSEVMSITEWYNRNDEFEQRIFSREKLKNLSKSKINP